MSEVVNDDSMRDELIRDIQLTIARWNKKLHLIDGDIAELLEQLEDRISKKQFVETRATA